MRRTFVLCLLLAATGPTGSGQVSQLTFSAADVAEVGGARITFYSTVGPAGFFKDLRRVETPSGTKYAKASVDVRFFPDHLAVSVVAVQISSFSKKKVSQDLMNELHFDGHWKRGMYLRHVKNLSLTSHTPKYYSSALGEGWTYGLDLDDSEVPLDDHLILDVLAPDNKRIARMSFSLSENRVKSN